MSTDPDLSARTMRIDITPATVVRGGRARRRTAAVDGFAPRRLERGDRNMPFDKLLESVYDAVLITDQRGCVLDFNARAEEFFILDASRLIGASVVDLISGADDSLLETIHQNLRDHKFTMIEAVCSRSDGSAFPVEIAVNRVNLNAEGQLCFFVRDTTVRKKAQQELENAVERLEALDRARLEFVSNVSHELRTPLTSMIYAVKNMLRGVAGPLTDKAIQYLERLDADCRRLLGTVNDILDLRQIENRSLTLTKARIPLMRLVESGVDALRMQADEKRVQVLTCLSPQQCFVLADPHKLERVILNILGNALKFTPGGGQVRLVVEPDADNPSQVVVRVSDNGIGIPREALDKVTLRYFKVGDQPTGSGLGLAISKELVELHGGSLVVESPVPGTGQGTQVTVRLPGADAPSLVVASGDAALRERIGGHCRSQGYVVTAVADGQALFAYCRNHTVDALVLDMDLVDMSATDVLLQLKHDRKTARLPVIVLAAGALARPQLEVLQGFGVPVLPKPPREQELACRLTNAFLGRTPLTTRCYDSESRALNGAG